MAVLQLLPVVHFFSGQTGIYKQHQLNTGGSEFKPPESDVRWCVSGRPSGPATVPVKTISVGLLLQTLVDIEILLLML